MSEILTATLKALKSSELSSYKIAQDTGISDQTIINYRNGTTAPRGINLKTLSKYLGVCEGGMLKEEAPSEGVSASSDQYPMVESYPIPVYNLDAVAGMNTPNAVVDMPAYIERWIQFPGARKGDIAFPVSNDSMTPRYLPGSLLQVRKVELWQEYFGYGNNFVLFLTDGRRILKEIQRSEEDPKTQVLCVSCNTKYPPEELPKSLIREVYKVIKSLSDEGF